MVLTGFGAGVLTRLAASLGKANQTSRLLCFPPPVRLGSGYLRFFCFSNSSISCLFHRVTLAGVEIVQTACFADPMAWNFHVLSPSGSCSRLGHTNIDSLGFWEAFSSNKATIRGGMWFR